MIGKDKVEEILKEFVDGGHLEQMAEEKLGCKLCDLGRDQPPKKTRPRAPGRMGGRGAGRRAKRAGG